MELKKNTILEVTMEGCSGDGSGVARVNGLVVFVKGALRGETCEIRLLKVRKTMAFARVERVIVPSPMRQAPTCPHFGVCGGCAFWHMEYREELEIKRLHVEDTLKRIGGLSLPVPSILGAEAILHYRNKTQYPVSSGAGGVKIGFYRARSHDVKPIDRCLIVNDAANAAAGAVRLWMTEYDIPAYAEETGDGLVRHVFVRTNSLSQALICLVVNGERLPHEDALISLLRSACPSCAGILLSINRSPGNVILGKRFKTLWGQDYLTDELFGLRFQLSVPSFYQVNRAQTLRLYETAIKYAGLTGRETVLDLYCGIGTIALCMARRAGRVLGVEIVPEAINDAKENAARNGIQNASFYCGDAGTAANALQAEGLTPDIVVVDPPRKGLSQSVIDEITALSPQKLVYVSCDPATLARDLKLLTQRGFAAKEATAVDMFPRTAHVETVVLLSQQKPNDRIEIDLDLDELDPTPAESKATYEEIKDYVLQNFNLKVSNLYISQVKRKYGLEVGENYNLSKSENPKVPQCPPDKEEAIKRALIHFQMITE